MWAELLHIGRSLFASQFSVEIKSHVSVSHAALLQTEFSIIFSRFGGGGGGGGDGGGGDFSISPNRTIPPILQSVQT